MPPRGGDPRCGGVELEQAAAALPSQADQHPRRVEVVRRRLDGHARVRTFGRADAVVGRVGSADPGRVGDPACAAAGVDAPQCATAVNDGEVASLRARATMVFVLDGSAWKIAHEHFSPFIANSPS